ncbi:location of vulva defective 1-like [Mizuhopecten yessoensis]|uniref:location of vulva defective 1-like n=1 Tax=Mizuhopecten yessoensis TaxID=6573 RepID=UPI000B45A8AD|nr:location of vulva defective 1-like [Mizuhopecten yessoensis]
MFFETPNTNRSFESWLKESTLFGWSYKLPTDAKFQTGRPFFDLYVSDNTDDDKAWIAVALWNSSIVSLTNHTPMFLCSTSHDQPHTLMKETIATVPPVTLTVGGCYPWYNTASNLAFTNTASMTVEMCMTECVSQATVYAFLESGNKCNCGDIIGASIDSPGHCGGGCAGDSAQVCGTTDGFFIAYATGVGAGSQATNSPTTGSSSVSHDGVPGSTMSTVLLTSVTKTILAGDLNTTVELTSPTSGSLLYIRAVELLYKDNSNTPVTSTYSVWYQLHPEGEHILATTFDQSSYPQFYPTDGGRIDLDVLPAWNLTFVFSSTPTDGQAVITIYTIGDDDFVTGYLFSIMSFKSIDVTTTTAQETPSTTDTASTISETSTKAVETTTIENATAAETTTPEETTQSEIATTTIELTTPHIETSTAGSTTSMQETTMSVATTDSDETTASNEITTITHLGETTTAVSANSVGTETTATLSTTDQTALVTVTASVCLCTCVTSNFNLTAEQLEETIQELKKSLTVSKTELSSYKRKLISAPDSRQSAASIGYVGVLVIGFVFGSVVFCDGISLYRALAKK